MKTCLNLVPAFRSLSDTEHDALRHVLRYRRVVPGEILARQGEPCQDVLMVARGRLKRVGRIPKGQHQILEVLHPGDFLGERALLHTTTHTADVVALTEAEICTLWQQDFQEVVTDYPEIALKLLGALSLRLAETESSLAAYRVMPPRERVLRSLESRLAGRRPPAIVQMPHLRTWADDLGVRSETLEQILRGLEVEGLLTCLSESIVQIQKPLYSRFSLI